MLPYITYTKLDCLIGCQSNFSSAENVLLFCFNIFLKISISSDRRRLLRGQKLMKKVFKEKICVNVCLKLRNLVTTTTTTTITTSLRSKTPTLSFLLKYFLTLDLSPKLRLEGGGHGRLKEAIAEK